MIRIWQAFSCNNSSAYRIVARFADPAIAERAAGELRALLAAHAAEVDANPEDQREPTEAQRSFAERHGFAWPEVLWWGYSSSGKLTGYEPALWVAGTVLVIGDTETSGFTGFARYLGACGATLEVDANSGDCDLTPVTVLFAWPANTALAAAWRDITRRLAANDDDPWGQSGIEARALFCDGETGGLCCELRPWDNGALDTLKAWLAGWGVVAPSITLCDDNDAFVFERIPKAACSACGGPLCYLDPRIHDIERAQLLCRPCGGFYELEVLLEIK